MVRIIIIFLPERSYVVFTLDFFLLLHAYVRIHVDLSKETWQNQKKEASHFINIFDAARSAAIICLLTSSGWREREVVIHGEWDECTIKAYAPAVRVSKVWKQAGPRSLARSS